MQEYMMLPQVKAALHVPADAVFYDSDGMGAQYTYGSTDQVTPPQKRRRGNHHHHDVSVKALGPVALCSV